MRALSTLPLVKDGLISITLAASLIAVVLVVLPHPTGVSGVVRGQNCTQIRTSRTCAVTPVKATVSVTDRPDSPNRLFAIAETGDDGRFQIALQPGTYWLSAANKTDNKSQVQSKQVRLTVRANETANVRIDLESSGLAQ
jgi:hypothetical protein